VESPIRADFQRFRHVDPDHFDLTDAPRVLATLDRGPLSGSLDATNYRRMRRRRCAVQPLAESRASEMILHIAASSALQTIKVIAICVLLVLLEFAGVAVLIAPRAVARKLWGALRAVIRRLAPARVTARRDRPVRSS
jgi:hypothetical protein